MTTPLRRPEATVTIGPLAVPVIVAPETVVYSEGFEGGVANGWAAGSGSSAAPGFFNSGGVPLPYGHDGSVYMLTVRGTPTFAGTFSAVRTLTGLQIGRDYTLRAWAGRRPAATITNARAGVSGIGFGTSITPLSIVTGVTANWQEVTYTFTATATSHTLILEHTSSSGTSADSACYWDDVSLTALEITTDTPVVDVSEGSVTLDAMAVPYGSATLTIPLDDASLVEQLDPRDDLRATITASAALDASDEREFDLAVRRRVADHKQKTIRLDLATDEALLMDYAPLADGTGARAHEASLRAVCNYVLGTAIPGAALEASPNPDADVTAAWPLVNYFVDPFASGITAFSLGTNASALTASATYTTGGGAATSLRWTATAAGTSNLILAASAKGYTRVREGDPWTISAYIRSSVARAARIDIRWYNQENVLIATTSGTAVNTSTSAFVRIHATGVAPSNAAYISPFITTTSNTAGQYHYVDAVLFTQTAELVPFFGGATTGGGYTYAWEGTTNDSTSVRTPTVERLPELFTWPAGTSAWEFLEPLTAGAGLRLYCDEQRKWRLIDPAEYAVAGRQNVSPLNATEGTDTISLDDPEVYCTGVLVRYRWTDSKGAARERVDAAGTPGLILQVEIARPYPGPGVAAAMLARRTGQGRQQEVTALADWTATPAQEASISLPGTLDQLGQIEAVEWGLTDALMNLKTRALTEIVPGSVNALAGTINALSGTINAL